MFLQETHSSKRYERIWNSQWGSKIYYNHGATNSQGVAIAFHKNLEISNVGSHKLIEGRILSVSAIVNNQKIFFVNIYAPNEDNIEFFQTLFKYIEAQEHDHVIVGGDLNKTLDDKLDRSSSLIHSTSRFGDFINTFLEENLWVDVWRNLHITEKQFPWHRRNPSIQMSRLDYFLTPMSTYSQITKCEILPGILTDHAFVYLEFELCKDNRGMGLWKIAL